MCFAPGYVVATRFSFHHLGVAIVASTTNNIPRMLYLFHSRMWIYQAPLFYGTLRYTFFTSAPTSHHHFHPLHPLHPYRSLLIAIIAGIAVASSRAKAKNTVIPIYTFCFIDPDGREWSVNSKRFSN